MKVPARDSKLFGKPNLLVLGVGSVLLPLAVVALLNFDQVFATLRPCPIGVLKTPAIYVEHVADEDKPIDPLVIASQPLGDLELCAGTIKPSLRRATRVHVVDDEELAQAMRILEMNTGDSGESEFRYVLVKKGQSPQSGSLDLQHSRLLLRELTTYFTRRRPDLNHELNRLSRRLGPT
jgi:hypothetical protein